MRICLNRYFAGYFQILASLMRIHSPFVGVGVFDRRPTSKYRPDQMNEEVPMSKTDKAPYRFSIHDTFGGYDKLEISHVPPEHN